VSILQQYENPSIDTAQTVYRFDLLAFLLDAFSAARSTSSAEPSHQSSPARNRGGNQESASMSNLQVLTESSRVPTCLVSASLSSSAVLLHGITCHSSNVSLVLLIGSSTAARQPSAPLPFWLPSRVLLGLLLLLLPAFRLRGP